MTPEGFAALFSDPGRLTVNAILLGIIYLLIAGHLVGRPRLEDWKSRSEEWKAEATKNRDALLAITNDMQELTRAIQALAPALAKLGDEQQEILKRIETLSQGCRSIRRVH